MKKILLSTLVSIILLSNNLIGQINLTQMSYEGCIVEQVNTANVPQGSKNKEILKITIKTKGVLEPIKISNFLFNRNITNMNNNVTSAKIFLTANFDINNKFGETSYFDEYPGNNINYSINGFYTLSTGNNYFWLVFDVKDNATINDVLDAKLCAITLNNSLFYLDGNPIGDRKIIPSYCPISYIFTKSLFINRVLINTLDNSSSNGNYVGYSDFTYLTTPIWSNTSNTLTINTNNYSSDFRYYVYIDYNQDGDFQDIGEIVFIDSKNFNTVEFNVPDGAKFGETRMRIMVISSNSGGFSYTGCGTNFISGETEDYTVIISKFKIIQPPFFINNSIIDNKNDFNKIIDYSITPNPSKDYISITSSNNSILELNVKIMDISGKTIISSLVQPQEKIDISNLINGTYFININNGNQLVTKKFIKN